MTEETETLFNQAKQLMLNANRICIISHRGPDGDAVGSNLALRRILEKMGKEVVSACVDPIQPDSIYLDKADTFVNDFDYEYFDLLISVDCATWRLVNFPATKPELSSGRKPFINIDHHESNEMFGTLNIVDGEACATCCVLSTFFNFCEWDFDSITATCLLHGIYFDTGSLMHSNTTADVYLLCGELMAKGANLRKIAKHLFQTTEINKMRLWGRILERAYINEEGVTVSAVNTEDYLACNASSKDTGGAIDYLNAVPNSKYCVLLSEDREKGIVKGSMRTQRNDVNLSNVASQWGGGGHPKASGFGIDGVLKPLMKWQIVGENLEGTNGEKIEF